MRERLDCVSLKITNCQGKPGKVASSQWGVNIADVWIRYSVWGSKRSLIIIVGESPVSRSPSKKSDQ